MAELHGRGHERPDDLSSPQRDAGRDRLGQPRDGETRRFEQGVRDYLTRHRGADRTGRDQGGRGPDRPTRRDSARSAESARFDAGVRQYLDRHRTGDRPGRQADLDKTDRAIADRHARRPQYARERQAIWDKIREASETFGEPSTERRRPATPDRESGDTATHPPDPCLPKLTDSVMRKAQTEQVELVEQNLEKITEVSADRPRGRAIRDKIAEKSEDILERVQDSADMVDALIKPPSPTGYRPVVGVPDNPTQISQHYAAHSPGDMVTAIAAAGFVAADLGRRAHEKISDWKERHGGHG